MKIQTNITSRRLEMFRKIFVIAAMVMLSIGALTGIASANVVNGGFETGDFTGWTLTNIDPNNDFVFVIGDSLNPSLTAHSGNSEALLGKAGAVGSISQSFATTSGQAYKVSFWLANDDINTANTNVFQALWNGQVQIINPVLNPDLASDYTQYQFIATASGLSSSIAFNFQNDPSTFHLDDVNANPVPIPSVIWLLGSSLIGLLGIRRKVAA
jgi:hypothetical protein